MKTIKIFLAIFFSIAVAACGGGGSSSSYGGGGGPSITTIASMPYNGSVTGTSDSYYRYTTVGTVSTINATGLTGDIDPKVYTDATFTTLSSNWSCTVNLSTTSDSCTATTAVPASTVLYIKARNYTSTGATFTLSVTGAAGGGTTLTLSAIPSITGLTYNTTLSTAPTTIYGMYTRVWTNTAGAMVDLLYTTSATEDVLGVAINNTSTSPTYWAGTPPSVLNIICHVSGTNPSAYPTCASWGISVSRSAGTLTLSNTPIFDGTTIATAGTANGSLTFTPF